MAGSRPLLGAGVVLAIFLIISNDDEDFGDAIESSRAPTTSPSDPTPAATVPASTGQASTSGGSGKPIPEPIEPDKLTEIDDDGTRHLTGVDGKTVAITFSGGPDPDYTPKVLDIMDDHDVVATFCVGGQAVVDHPELVARISDEGHTLCNHTHSGDLSLRFKRLEVIEREMTKTREGISAADETATVPFFRAPGGYFDANLNSIAVAQGMDPLGWSIDSEDWRDKDADAIQSTVMNDMHPGAIVLLSDGGGDRSATVQALPGVIDALHDAGYDFVIPHTAAR